MTRNVLILCLVFLLAGDIAASPRDAQALALADLAGVPPGDRPFMRYVYNRGGQINNARMVSLTVNVPSRAALIAKPAIVAPIVSRIDLRKYARTVDDLKEWLELWEEFAFDP